MDWDGLTADERLVAEQAILNLRSLNDGCDEAADGTVLAIAERLALAQGRELIKKTLQVSVDRQVEAVEKKGRRHEAARAD
jgi:hypothetical protein